MAMFGFLQQPQQKFDRGPTAAYGQGVDAYDAAPKKKGGGIGNFLMNFAIARGASGGNPAAQMYLRRQGELQDQEAEEQQYQRKLADQWSMWERQQEYQRDNPNPVNNDTVNDYNFIRQTLGDDAAKDYLRNRSDPVVNIPLPGGDVYVGPRSGLPGAGAARQSATQPPQAAIDHLRSNPSLKAAFDAKYGQGAADRALGGPTPTASGGFPGVPR